MLINDTPPAIRRIDTDRDDAFGFEIAGKMTAADIENMIGLLEGAYALHDKIDVLLVINVYDGFEWSALLREDTYLGKAHALKHIRKYAFVGGPNWMKAGVAMTTPFLPIEVKQFARNEVDKAWAWLGARPLPLSA